MDSSVLFDIVLLVVASYGIRRYTKWRYHNPRCPKCRNSSSTTLTGKTRISSAEFRCHVCGRRFSQDHLEAQLGDESD